MRHEAFIIRDQSTNKRLTDKFSNYATDDFDNREDQSDTRDGDDTSLNASFEKVFDNGGKFDISAMWVDTDRTEDERSFEYDDASATSGSVVEPVSLEARILNNFLLGN